jgi:Uma2 family endonuclease
MATLPAAGSTGLTYEDLRRFPNDHLRREIIDGELFVTPAPTTRHQGVVVELVVRLGLYAKEHGGRVLTAPTDVFLSERDVVEPDVLFVTEEHRARVELPFVRGAPDVVVEVSSPSTRRFELVRKRRVYEAAGVPEYWYVDLDADRVEVHRLEGGHYPPPAVLSRGDRLASALLPGLDLPVDDLLAEPGGADPA